jgi:hypothetical protein
MCSPGARCGQGRSPWIVRLPECDVGFDPLLAQGEPAGFSGVEVAELPGSMVFTDFEDFWTLQSEVSGPVALLLASLPADGVAAIRPHVGADVTDFETPDGYAVRSLAIGVSAR